jgi:hypothetical protein
MFKDDRFLRNPFRFVTHQSFHHLVLHNIDSESVVTSSIRNLSQKWYILWDITQCNLHAFTLVYWLLSSAEGGRNVGCLSTDYITTAVRTSSPFYHRCFGRICCPHPQEKTHLISSCGKLVPPKHWLNFQ